jgi:hypothetical protein
LGPYPWNDEATTDARKSSIDIDGVLSAALEMILCALALERPALGKDGRLAKLSMMALCQCFARRVKINFGKS